MKIRTLVGMILLGLMTADTWAGEILYPATQMTRLSSGRTVYVPEAKTTSDYGLGIRGQLNSSDGVWVTEVERDTTAARIGLESGDWIVAVNNRAIRNVNDWHALMNRRGTLRLTVKDVRTGTLVTRDVRR